jgi:hypothetical protein
VKTRPGEWLFGAGAFVAVTCCALSALVSGAAVLVGGLALGSSVLIMVGAALVVAGIRRRRPVGPTQLSAAPGWED